MSSDMGVDLFFEPMVYARLACAKLGRGGMGVTAGFGGTNAEVAGVEGVLGTLFSYVSRLSEAR